MHRQLCQMLAFCQGHIKLFLFLVGNYALLSVVVDYAKKSRIARLL